MQSRVFGFWDRVNQPNGNKFALRPLSQNRFNNKKFNTFESKSEYSHCYHDKDRSTIAKSSNKFDYTLVSSRKV